MDFEQKNKRLEQRRQTILLSVMIMFILFSTSFSSAWTSSSFTEDSELILEKESLTKYGTYKIEESKWWDVLQIWTKEIIKEIDLKTNTESCIDCLSEGTIILNKDGYLIDDLIWMRSFDEGKTFVEWKSYTNWKLLVEEDVDVFETTCKNGTEIYDIKNGTSYFEQDCTTSKIGTEKQWNNLDFKKEYKAGTYNYKIEGSKKASVIYDWVIKTNGQLLENWAVWGAVIGVGGVEANVTLNSPADASTEYNNPVIMVNASANVTGGAYLINATLYDNSTGSWGSRNTSPSFTVSNTTTDPDSFTNPTYAFDGISTTYANKDTTVVGNLTKVLGKTFNNTYVSNVIVNASYKMTYTLGGDNGGIFNITLQSYDGSNWNNESTLATHSGLIGGASGTTINYSSSYSLNKYVQGLRIAFIFDTTGGSGIVNNNHYSNLTNLEWTYFPPSWTQTFNNTYPTGTYKWNMQFCDSDGDCGFATANRTFSLDSVSPTIFLSSGNGTQTYGNLTTNHTLNYTITDINLNSCWLNYNSTNRTIPCTSGAVNTTNFTLQLGLYNATLWANDTFGNTASQFFNWSYRFLYINESYTSSITEGVTSTFTLNLYTNGLDITIAQLNYDGVNSYGSITDNGGNFFTVTKTQAAPIVTTDTNKTFYWNLTQNSLGYYNFTPHNQTVLNFRIDNCSANTNVLYNFTIVDEEYQTEINETGSNSFTELNFQLYTYGTTTLVQEFISSYNKTNPFAVCFNNTLTTEQFNGDLQVKFFADTYETEYYHIQNATINATNMNKNITLYDLNTSDSQIFKIIFRDNSYTPINSALITIYRKYVDEGVFKIVEIPRTDVKGETLAHLVLNDIIYNFVISKNGINITSFNNVLAVCQTPLVSPCIIDFTQPSGSIDVTDFYTNEDFNFTLTYNETSRIVSATYLIPSGTPSWVTLNVTSEDAVMIAVCSDYVTSASGTLTCTVPASIGNSTIRATLYRDGTYQAFGSVKLGPDASGIYGGVLILLSVIVLISIIGIGVSNNPIITVIFLMVGAILIYSLNLVTNHGFLGATATILFLLIGCVLMLIKGARRN